jgi:hypothetical protein
MLQFSMLKPPSEGNSLTKKSDGLAVPDDPIVPFIEGDGIGPDIWRASRRVFDEAVTKAYGGKRHVVRPLLSRHAVAGQAPGADEYRDFSGEYGRRLRRHRICEGQASGREAHRDRDRAHHQGKTVTYDLARQV